MRITVITVALLAALAAPASAKSSPREIVALPNGFQPEGIASSGNTLFTGSRVTGAIFRASARTGRGRIISPAMSGRAAFGMKVVGHRLFVAGGPTGKAWVYDTRTGRTLAAYTLTTGQTFVNDVVVSRGTAYFTDSVNQQLFAVRHGRVRTIPLRGDVHYDNDPNTFELNGIDTLGRDLVSVQTRNGRLFRIDPRRGTTVRIPIRGSLANGDGLLRRGRTLYVVRNQNNRLAVVDLGRRRVTRTLTDSDLQVPTGVTRAAGALYLVNAKFGAANAGSIPYELVRVG